MKLLSFRVDGLTRGAMLVYGLAHPLRRGVTILDVVRAGLPVEPERWLSDEEPVALEDLVLDSPYLPPTIRDFVAFEEHVEGVRRSIDRTAGVVAEWYEAPTFYFTNPYAVVATGDPVTIPHGSEQMDFELEVGIVVGRRGQDISPQNAKDHVFGYTILNDWSARDVQRREMKVGLGPAKGKDFASTLGPVLVTADELEPYRDPEGFLDLAMSVSVNGVEIGRDLLSNMGWPDSDLVAYASRGTWVHPGDLLGTGTSGNGGCLAELWGRNGRLEPLPLQAGDVVTMSVEGIGSISNVLVAGAPPPPVPAARTRPRDRPTDARIRRE